MTVAVVALEITGASGLTVRLSVPVPVPPAFVALKLTVEFVAAVGVPEIKPLAVFTDSPAG